ncbi:hypothetical protein AAFF_G00036840 [Aldrovandia affinis]|uniref:Uncharacterized protein n=1 Tax=Aldrovandia affinis TaxID=143900 RepID=A0AAD7T4V3_9TELE|nr:hypothetical protein AAFF_G00036840 [Aldrovandia affinis]
MMEGKDKEQEQVALNPMINPPPYPSDKNPFRADQYVVKGEEEKQVSECSDAVGDRQEYAMVAAREEKEEKRSTPTVKPKVPYTSTSRGSMRKHITHYVEQHRKEKKDADEQSKQLASKLTQLQLGELTKLKKDKEKTDKGSNEYQDEDGNPVNAKGGPLECPFGNPLCEYGVRGGAGWECWNYHPLAAKLVKDPRFWADYAALMEKTGANGTRRSDPTSCASCVLRRPLLSEDPLQCTKHLG